MLHNYGLYHRHEISSELKTGTKIKFNSKIYDQITGMGELRKLFRKRDGVKKLSPPKNEIFLSLNGFAGGQPVIKVRKSDGEIGVVCAIGYQFAEGKNKIKSICDLKVCSRSQRFETTKENRL